MSMNQKINLEMNVNIDEVLINRNLTYASHIFSSQMKNKEDYAKISPVIQFNFNLEDVDDSNEDIIDVYYFRNKNNHILSKSLQICNINIERCRKLWYNEDISKYTIFEQKIIKLGALMCIDIKENFSKCIGEMEMSRKLREDIEEVIDEFSSNDEIMAHFNSEKDLIALERGQRNLAVKKAVEKAVEKAVAKAVEKTKEETTKEVTEKSKIEIASNFLKNGADIELISKSTGLSKSDILKLK
jgi:predicted transposase/invertase (TIGR01784 family)